MPNVQSDSVVQTQHAKASVPNARRARCRPGLCMGARRRTVGVPSGGASQWGVRYSAASHQLATAADACWEKLIVLLQARWSVAIGGHAARGHARAALAREVCVLRGAGPLGR